MEIVIKDMVCEEVGARRDLVDTLRKFRTTLESFIKLVG